MNNIDILKQLFPLPIPLRLGDIKTPITYIGAVGFEDRSIKILIDSAEHDNKIESTILIKYEPFDDNNREKDFIDVVNRIGINSEKQFWITYNRFEPELFAKSFSLIRKNIKKNSNLLIDISGMSKFLIIVLMEELKNLNVNIIIGYVSAKIYHPTREQFEKEKNTLPEATPDFLTTDVYKIVTTIPLSSVTMQGYPIIMIAFPTFNHRELMALLNEVTPQKLILLEGSPNHIENKWRLEAIRWINRKIEDFISTEKHIVDTVNYLETIFILEEVYQRYNPDHKIIIAPTGSKLQTVAVYLFKQIHPDIQVVYPVTRQFAKEYTEDSKCLIKLLLPDFQIFLSKLDQYRKLSLHRLGEFIESLES